MPQTNLEQQRDDRPNERLERPRERALAVSLWLIAAVLAEAELLLWALERAQAS